MVNEQILIVDDSVQNVNFLTEQVLIPNGYQPLVAQDGETGLNMALNQNPDLILLDINVSKMNGMELLDAINIQNLNMPVIIMDSRSDETSALHAFRMGVKDYVLKPFEASDMLNSIQRALTEIRLSREKEALSQRLEITDEKLQKRLRELNTLFGISKSVMSVLDRDKLLSLLVEAAIYLTDAEEGSLMLVDDKTDELYIVAARGMDNRVARSFRLPVQNSLAGEVVISGQPVIMADEDALEIKSGYLVHSLIYVPLLVKERVGGVLAVNNRQQIRSFSNHNLRLLSALADYAAIFLENARVYKLAVEEQAKLASIMSEVEEPVVVVAGQESQVVTSNAAFRRAFELEEDAVNGRPLSSSIGNQTLLDLVIATNDTSTNYKNEVSLDDGRTFYITVTPIPNVGRAIVMQDVSYFKALDRMKSDFVSTVSHDLRAPLNSIKEYAQMLGLVGELNQKQQLFVNCITKGAEQITTLVDNLLDLSSIEADIGSSITVVDLGQLTTTVMAAFQSQAGRKRQKLIGHIAGEPVPVAGNLDRLQQVVANLIDNALKCTPNEGQISVIIQAVDKQVVFKIEDNGLGIPPADLPFLFDKFFRVKDKDQNNPRGAGLGLAICKSIIEKYGGHIWAENQPDQGSVFTFTLPLAPIDGNNLANSIPVEPETVAM